MVEKVQIEERKVRQHGLEWPLHPTQVLTFMIFGGDILSYYMINLVSLGHNIQLVIILGSVYLILAIGTFYYGYIASKINPQDPTIKMEALCKKVHIKFESQSYDYHCSICNSHVLSGSKHCGKCNRCTSGFDHHCQYLNNCIGEQNYDQFFKLIIWVFWMCLMHNITNGFVIYHIAQNSEKLMEMHLYFYDVHLMNEFKIILIVLCFLNTCALIFLFKLIIFHIELRYKGLTTYQFLKLQENDSRESKIVVRVNQDSQRNEMRIEEEDRQKIKQEQQILLAKILQIENDQQKNKLQGKTDYRVKENDVEFSPKQEIEKQKKNEDPLDDAIIDNKDKINQDEIVNQIEENDEKIYYSEQNPSKFYVLKKMLPCFAYCLTKNKNSQVVQTREVQDQRNIDLKIVKSEEQTGPLEITQMNEIDLVRKQSLNELTQKKKQESGSQINLSDQDFAREGERVILSSRNQSISNAVPNQDVHLAVTNQHADYMEPPSSIVSNRTHKEIFKSQVKIRRKSNVSQQDIQNMVIKFGTGMDNQDHISTPVSIRSRRSLVSLKKDLSAANIYNQGASEEMKFKGPRATSSYSQKNAYDYNSQSMISRSQDKVIKQSRPYSNYQSQQKTIKRIQSELETIKEGQEDGKNDYIVQQLPDIDENVMVDESYSFSLRQYDKGQQSRRNLDSSLGQVEQFDQRNSSFSQYGNAQPLSGRGRIHTGVKLPSSKSIMLASTEFGPFSKNRKQKLQQINSERDSPSPILQLRNTFVQMDDTIKILEQS